MVENSQQRVLWITLPIFKAPIFLGCDTCFFVCLSVSWHPCTKHTVILLVPVRTKPLEATHKCLMHQKERGALWRTRHRCKRNDKRVLCSDIKDTCKVPIVGRLIPRDTLVWCQNGWKHDDIPKDTAVLFRDEKPLGESRPLKHRNTGMHLFSSCHCLLGNTFTKRCFLYCHDGIEVRDSCVTDIHMKSPMCKRARTYLRHGYTIKCILTLELSPHLLCCCFSEMFCALNCRMRQSHSAVTYTKNKKQSYNITGMESYPQLSKIDYLQFHGILQLYSFNFILCGNQYF